MKLMFDDKKGQIRKSDQRIASLVLIDSPDFPFEILASLEPNDGLDTFFASLQVSGGPEFLI